MSIRYINIDGSNVEVEDNIARTNIGTLSNLPTEDKSSVVNAINEICLSVGIMGDLLDSLETRAVNNSSNIQKLQTSSEWVEITSSNGQEAEITQEFSEIRLLAKGTNANYSVTYSYDSTIFHNNSSDAPTYMICGNPTENNYGCKFKYMVTTNGKQYVCVDKCFSGGGYDAIEFRAWIKPVQSEPQ